MTHGISPGSCGLEDECIGHMNALRRSLATGHRRVDGVVIGDMYA